MSWVPRDQKKVNREKEKAFVNRIVKERPGNRKTVICQELGFAWATGGQVLWDEKDVLKD